MKKSKAKGQLVHGKKKGKLKAMLNQINDLILYVKKHEKLHKKKLKKVHPDNLKSAKNLIHYRLLRKNDIRSLQKQLGDLGLSRMAKSQGSVLASLQSTRLLIKAILGIDQHDFRSGLSIKKAMQVTKRNAKTLLGYRSNGRHTRIMVTMPSQVSWDYELVKKMIEKGMNCARINCAHDDEVVWMKMIENIRKASKKLKKRCKISMDLGGPKIRTGSLTPGPKVLKLRPEKDKRGVILRDFLFWIGTDENNDLETPFITISKAHFDLLNEGDSLYFLDTRNKKRVIKIKGIEKQKIRASVFKTSYLETGMKLYFDKDRKGSFIIVGELLPLEIPIILKEGDYLRINYDQIPGKPLMINQDRSVQSIAHIACTLKELFADVKTGEPILFDDGKIRGTIVEIHKTHTLVKINTTMQGGGKLRADKGINLPESNLSMDGLTEKDKKDLKFVVKHADMINFSFVNSKEDVQNILSELKLLKAKPGLGLILKIETQKGFNQLTDIILEAMQLKSIGVMIARGDLAIEVGWENIGRVQQEILSLCESAHIPDIWATQVLETLAKKGMPSRAEITDAIKSQQADCVMLNKGPYILESIKILDAIFKNMEPFREKSARLTPVMSLAAP